MATKTEIKAYRRDVRRALGTSSDPVPSVEYTLIAALALSELLSATSARYNVKITDRKTGEVMSTGEAVKREQDALRVQHERRNCTSCTPITACSFKHYTPRA